MVLATRLNGKEFHINPDLILIIEETPDTVITLTTGQKYVITENADLLIARIIAYRQEVYTRLPVCRHTEA